MPEAEMQAGRSPKANIGAHCRMVEGSRNHVLLKNGVQQELLDIDSSHVVALEQTRLIRHH